MLHTEKLKQRLTCATYVHMRDACVHKKACHMCAFSCMLHMRSGMYATHELCTLLLACCVPVARFNFCVCGTQVRFCVLLICSYMHATHELCTLLLACCMPVARFNFCVCGTQALWYISACLPGRCGTCAASLYDAR